MSFHSLEHLRASKFNSSESCKFLEDYDCALNSYILSKSSENPSQSIAPSSIRCLRKSWFRLSGACIDPPHVDSQLDFFAAIGTACHQYIQSILSVTNQWVPVDVYFQKFPPNYSYELQNSDYETRISISSPPIRFACDGILLRNDTYYLLEIKSIDSGAFVDLSNPLSKHIDQVKTYCALFNLKQALIVYIDRSYGKIKCYEVSFSSAELQSAWQIISDIEKYHKLGIAPPGLPKGDSWCTPSMCPYYQKCSAYGRYSEI